MYQNVSGCIEMCQNVSKCVRMCQNVTNYVLEWMGLDFYYYDGLQPKMSGGMIKETLAICTT